jgi:hypothetical protein
MSNAFPLQTTFKDLSPIRVPASFIDAQSHASDAQVHKHVSVANLAAADVLRNGLQCEREIWAAMNPRCLVQRRGDTIVYLECRKFAEMSPV